MHGMKPPSVLYGMFTADAEVVFIVKHPGSVRAAPPDLSHVSTVEPCDLRIVFSPIWRQGEGSNDLLNPSWWGRHGWRCRIQSILPC